MRIGKLWFVFILLTLSGCQQEKTMNYFLTHPQEIQSTYDDCINAKDRGSQKPTDCMLVYRVIPVVQANLTELINSPWQFGLKIMHAQSALVKLLSELKIASQGKATRQEVMNLQAAIAAQRTQIESRYALIRLLSRAD